MFRSCIIVVCIVLSGFVASACADAESDFNSLFGDEIKRVTASRNGKAAAELAAQMMLAAKSVENRPDLHVLLWTRAAEFGAKSPSGYKTAIQAVKNLLQAKPDDRPRWIEKLSSLHKRRYATARGKERIVVGQELIDDLLAIADAQTRDGQGSAALATYRKAMPTATVIRSPRKGEILNKIKAANALALQQREIEKLKRILAENPDDAKTRTAIVRMYLLELDKPAQAAKLLTDDLDEQLRTYVVLAAKDIAEVKPAACYELGRWYWEMFPTVKTSRAKLVILRRTRAYLQRFLSLHTAKDTSALMAAVILKKVDAESQKLALKGQGALTKPSVIASFESPRLIGWKAAGRAFGKGPCTGKPVPTYPARGFDGKLMISSYHEGDDSTGTLTSPKFLIRGKSITFLVGGGAHPGKTCMNLYVGGKLVRTVTGHTSNTLRADGWDVADLVGKTAQLQMVDAQKGHWGHILVDQIVQHPGKLETVLKTKRPTK